MLEQEALVVLNAIPGVGNATIQKLRTHFGSARQIFRLDAREVSGAAGLAFPLAQKIFDFPRDSFLKNEYNLVGRSHVEVVTIDDRSYPEALRHIPGAPVVLYVKGSLPAYPHVALAVVGSRRAALYGIRIARSLSSRLAELGIVIASGLARGIDAAAHEGTLQVNGVTVAVLGCGLAQIYPPEHAPLAERIVEQGALISEFPMTVGPLAVNFPRRNRIISGLCAGVVVVEAANRSGAMITAQFALEQGRDVFAVPGPVDHPNSRGVHRLIQQGAKLVSCPEDILEELLPQLQALRSGDSPMPMAAETEQEDSMPEGERLVWQCVTDEKMHIDQVGARVALDRQVIFSALLSLERKNKIRRLPGNYYVKTVLSGSKKT